MENTKKTKSFSKLALDWTVMLCNVLLFSSAINCLFQVLAYGKAFDIALFILSLGLGLLVYLKAMDPKKNPIVKKRLAIALCSLIAWAALIPVLQMLCR